MLRKKVALLLLTVLCILPVAACSGGGQSEMKDGYYTAQMDGYSHGWKEFVTITVRDGNIISAEYNAVNESGFIKSWDNAYMRNMKAVSGTYPNEYTRNYAAQLLENQSSGVHAIGGASSSAKSFDLLAAAVIEQARKGDSQTATVQSK